jgi:hypothetical protein
VKALFIAAAETFLTGELFSVSTTAQKGEYYSPRGERKKMNSPSSISSKSGRGEATLSQKLVLIMTLFFISDEPKWKECIS